MGIQDHLTCLLRYLYAGQEATVRTGHGTTDQYSILTHIYGIWKDGNDNRVCETAKDTQVYRTVFWTLGEGEGGMIWENGTETYIMSYMKRIASPGLMHDTGCSRLVHWEDPEGCDGEGGGWGVQNGEYMYTHGGFMLMYGKPI